MSLGLGLSSGLSHSLVPGVPLDLIPFLMMIAGSKMIVHLERTAHSGMLAHLGMTVSLRLDVPLVSSVNLERTAYG